MAESEKRRRAKLHTARYRLMSSVALGAASVILSIDVGAKVADGAQTQVVPSSTAIIERIAQVRRTFNKNIRGAPADYPAYVSQRSELVRLADASTDTWKGDVSTSTPTWSGKSN